MTRSLPATYVYMNTHTDKQLYSLLMNNFIITINSNILIVSF